MSDIEIVESLKRDLGEKALDLTNPDVRRIFVKIAPPELVPVVTLLRDKYDCAYLATISGVDKGDTFEFLYHFASPVANINLRTEFPKSEPRIASICAVIPGAVLYERELQEMFGVKVEGIPDPRRLVLPDDWPEGQYPLRKDWKHVRPQEVIPGGKS
ncbi:MAG: NADH-quinone oxidoreductase subunit C [Acidobacteria bacterium]|nr:NADH-quinone oxidoreductase subunit C [Acidobacteriota bacterium]MBE3131820.1 NADH-quinone oxidoreductase subunit C [Acidobacteriota bacterium]MCX6571838.1 NADH-quinone oxidoreductase subunit C [Candidatus Aminicenantes bacterium]